MADRAISDLPLVDAIQDNDRLLLERSNSANAVTGGVIKAFARSAAAGVEKGEKGEKGVGIQSVQLVAGNHAAGTFDTYEIRLTDGTAEEFQVYNGRNGNGAVNSVNGNSGDVTTRIIKHGLIATNWSTDSTFEDFPYRASIGIAGVTTAHVPEVVFNPTDALSGNFAPVADTYNGGVYIYANILPEEAVTIPTIIVWR